MLILPAVKGFLLMCSMIIAIGPQNAFLLRQAVRREYAWLVASIMLCGDVLMVVLGGFGIGHLLENWPWIKLLLTIVGSAYIFHFGFGVFQQMTKPKALTIETNMGKKSTVTGAFAVTFLNPHVILDTVVIIGTLALQFHGMAKNIFMLGAIAGSTFWFFGIAWVGQRLAPYLSRAGVWRVIDGFIVVVMLLLSVSLAADAWGQGRALFTKPY